MSSQDIAAEIGRRVDALAMQVVLGDGSAGGSLAGVLEDCGEALRWIQQQAREAGMAAVEEAASSLLGTVQNSSPDGGADGGEGSESISQQLNAGITRLQEALARGGEPVETIVADTSYSAAQDTELVIGFIQETREHLTTIETQVLALEADPSKAEAIHSTFRCFHTIKGLAGFLELDAIRESAHEVESLLDLARNQKLAITPEVIDVVLAGADYLGQAVTALDRYQSEGGVLRFPDGGSLQQRIQAVIAGSTSPSPVETAGEELPPESAPEAVLDMPEEAPPVAAPTTTRQTPRDSFSVRVETAKLDYLVDMVGELVIAQAMIRQNPELMAAAGPRVTRTLTQLSRITSEVQKTTMSMRMVPVGQLFQRMTRLVRDLSRKSGKRVTLAVSGEDTELDKTIIEELSDPLMHMVRNALDHGIEQPEERTAAHKNPEGRVTLRAYHQAGHILIDVSDDGRGLNRDRIRKKAIERNLMNPEAPLADAELFNLIFDAGFSTAEKVTDISGRGVGMDVVRKQIQKLRGRVDIESPVGEGTTFHLRLPLTLAIIEGLVVGVGSERYIVPISAVQEMLRPTEDTISSVQGRHEMAMVREQLLPMVRLHQRFGVPARSEDPRDGLLIVVEGEGKRFCLLVDDFIGKQEVVIKSLGETLKETPGIAGGAILGDGRVGLILDLDGVFEAGRYA